MKKSIFLVCFLIFILLSFSSISMLLATGIIDNNKEEVDAEFNDVNDNKNNYILYSVSKGILTVGAEIKGKIMGSSEIKRYALNRLSKDFKCYVKVGDFVKEGSPLYINFSKKVTAKGNGRVLWVNQDNKFELAILPYDDSVIALEIPEKYQNYINANTIFEVTKEDGTIIKPKLVRLEPTIQEQLIRVELENEFLLLPESEVNVNVIFYEVKDCIIVPQEYVKKEDEEYYVQVVDDTEELKKIYVNIIDKNTDYYAIDLDDSYIGKMIAISQEEEYFKEKK